MRRSGGAHDGDRRETHLVHRGFDAAPTRGKDGGFVFVREFLSNGYT